MKAELASPLSREQCAAALREAVDDPWVPFGKKPVVGKVDDARAVLRKRPRGRNSFQTLMKLTMRDRPDGTALSCRAGMSIAVIVFMTFWLGAAIAIGGAVFLASVASLMGAGESEIPPAIGLAAPPAFILFGVLLLLGGRALARNEAGFLLDFVKTTLQARPLAAGEAREPTVG